MEIDMDEYDRQLFILPPEIWSAITMTDVEATSRDMFEMGLYFPPVKNFDIHATVNRKKMYEWIFKNMDVGIKDNHVFDAVDHLYTYRFRYDFDDSLKNYDWLWGLQDKKNNKIKYYSFDDPDLIQHLDDFYRSKEWYSEDCIERSEAQMKFVQKVLVTTLVATLAAKNIVKDVQKIKKHGANSKKRSKQYSYITTIKIGKISETNRLQEGSGSTVRPHLRRGHIRNQHFGEGNKEIKKIFIQPVFVNADEGWIENQRKAYVVKAA